jgi:NADH:ubiquinone reductase (non-electrogenic)
MHRAALRFLRSAAVPAAAASVAAASFFQTASCAPSASPVPVVASASPSVDHHPLVNANSTKKRVVVIGTGWAAVSFLQKLKADPNVEVTVISPRPFFLYSPLLPAAAVGSLEARSIIEPASSFLPSNGSLIEAEALSVDVDKQHVMCRSSLDPSRPFNVAYDTLVVAVGSVSNTFGTPGVSKNALFLKSAEDALRVRARVQAAFARASLPVTSPEEAARLLTFVVCGGGPTGSELSAELHDLISGDLARAYPAVAPLARIVVVDSNSHLLSTFDRAIAEYTTKKFSERKGIRLVLEARVTAVDADSVTLLHKATKTKEVLPAGTVVWATGVGLHPFAATLASALPKGAQRNSRALTVDDRLRVRGSRGTIYALGDTATLEQDRALSHAAELFNEFDVDGSGSLEVGELAALLEKATKDFPQFREHLRLFREGAGDRGGAGSAKPAAATAAATPASGGVASMMGGLFGTAAASSSPSSSSSSSLFSSISASGGGSEISESIKQIFAAADTNGDGMLSLEEFKALLAGVDSHLRALPATAQVAKQQGNYLADVANRGLLGPAPAPEAGAAAAAAPAQPPPFVWSDKGSFAFIGGDEAVAKIPGVGVLRGMVAGGLWRGFETANQQSMRNRVSVAVDMAKTRVFGRDVSTLRK